MSAVRTKRSRSRSEDTLHARKEENVHLHDEADLVDFRTDAYTRFVNNQELLENVALKPFHTRHIEPPSLFPTHVKKKYSDSASDEEVASALRLLKPEELWMGDIRLMRAKLKLSTAELRAARAELTQLKPKTVFDEKMQFQSQAVSRLATLQQSCTDPESFQALEGAWDEILQQYKQKFGQTLKIQDLPYERRKIPVAMLAPGIDVKAAPQLYNPHLIMSFINMQDNGNEGMGGLGFPDENMLLDGDKLAGQLPFMNGMQGNDEFGMVMDKPTGGYYNGNYNEYGANYGKPSNGNSLNENDVNMDELNQFLAEPNDNSVDDMDALMNFDQDNDNGSGMMGDDDFNVNFLQMDNGVE